MKKSLIGKNLAEVTMINGLHPTPSNAAEVLMDMVYVSNGRGIYHCLSELETKTVKNGVFLSSSSSPKS